MTRSALHFAPQLLCLFALLFALSQCYHSEVVKEDAAKSCPRIKADLSENPSCEEGKTRCVDEMVQRCVAGLWQDFSDCGSLQKKCALIKGEFTCIETVETPINTQNNKGAENEPATAPDSDTPADTATQAAMHPHTDAGVLADAGLDSGIDY